MTAMQVRRDVIFISNILLHFRSEAATLRGRLSLHEGKPRAEGRFRNYGQSRSTLVPAGNWPAREFNEYRLVTCRIARPRRNCRRACRPELPRGGYAAGLKRNPAEAGYGCRPPSRRNR